MVGWQRTHLSIIIIFVCLQRGSFRSEGGGGRLFVTMLGYPATCERGHVAHSCTLAFACWMVGGSSQPGCGASPWIVACCVTSSKPSLFKKQTDTQPNQIAVFQRRADDKIEECGLSADRFLQKRIIGGTEARFAQFPWQAHIRIAAYQCGGVLVSRKYVATAAHCIIKARISEIVVYLGELDTQDTGKVIEWAPAEYHRVRRKLIHPNFEFRSTQPDRYDLALLQLLTDAGHGFHILPVCLPPVGLELDGKSAVVAGWGKIVPSMELTGTNVLRSATVPILGREECIRWHRTKQIKVELHEEMFCAGHADGSRDACLGDSGGPLIVLEGGKWTLVGITSAGFGCGEPHQPGIYHSVAHTVDWIRSIIS